MVSCQVSFFSTTEVESLRLGFLIHLHDASIDSSGAPMTIVAPLARVGLQTRPFSSSANYLDAFCAAFSVERVSFWRFSTP